MTMKSGIYGVFRLDGAPVDPVDAAVLRLDDADCPGSAQARGVDHQMPDAVQRDASGGALTILVGHVEESADLAARLGLAPGTPPAVLARAALRRFGGDTPALMIGEWTLLHWDGARALTLMASAARRDRLLFAIAGDRVAVAADMFVLGRLAWVGSTLDEAGLMFALGRGMLRTEIGDRTMLRGVRQLEPGCSVTITSGRCAHARAATLAPQPRWTGSFEDAVDAAEQTLRGIMQERLARIARPAAMLSGGLDSSTLAWLAAEERAPGQDLLLMTSVAPPGSARPDERGFADMVATRLGLATTPVAPPDDADIYRPSDAILAGASGPPLPSRHCLTETFQRTARAHGAAAMFDGTFGEMTVTVGITPLSAADRLRRAIGDLRRRLTGPAPHVSATGPFHAKLAAHRLSHLPDAVRQALATPSSPAAARDGLWGYLPGATKSLDHANEFYAGAVRAEFPYRDVRLLRLFAGFPLSFMVRDGLARAPVRHMLDGHLPDAVRLRTSGMPASPDHLDRLQRQALAARERIGAFRQAEIDDWIDLDWLDQALLRVAAHGPAGYADANEVQLTAITAEFITWFRTRA